MALFRNYRTIETKLKTLQLVCKQKFNCFFIVSQLFYRFRVWCFSTCSGNTAHPDVNQAPIEVNNTIEEVDHFVYLGAVSINNYDDSKEIKRRLCIARSAMVSRPIFEKIEQFQSDQDKTATIFSLLDCFL